MKKTIGLVAVVSALIGCGSSASTTGDSASTSKASGSSSASASKDAKDGKDKDAKAAAGDGKWVKLDKANNVQIQVDPDAIVSDGVGSGNMVMSAVAPVSVKVATDTDPKSLDEYKKTVADFSPKNVKSDKLEGGSWWCTWENTGSAGTNYWLSVYREIDKKGYVCDTTLDAEGKRDAALKACKTLKM